VLCLTRLVHTLFFRFHGSGWMREGWEVLDERQACSVFFITGILTMCAPLFNSSSFVFPALASRPSLAPLLSPHILALPPSPLACWPSLFPACTLPPVCLLPQRPVWLSHQLKTGVFSSLSLACPVCFNYYLQGTYVLALLVYEALNPPHKAASAELANEGEKRPGTWCESMCCTVIGICQELFFSV
jgi:hypothetical protein